MSPHSKFDLGSETARHLGPTPRGRLKFALAVCLHARPKLLGPTEPSRIRRVKDARRSVTGPLSAASARYSRKGWPILTLWGCKTATFRNCDIEPLGSQKPGSFKCGISQHCRFTHRRGAGGREKSLRTKQNTYATFQGFALWEKHAPDFIGTLKNSKSMC